VAERAARPLCAAARKRGSSPSATCPTGRSDRHRGTASSIAGSRCARPRADIEARRRAQRHWQASHGFGDLGSAASPSTAPATPQANSLAVLTGNQPIAVVLDLVNPLGTARSRGRSRSDHRRRSSQARDVGVNPLGYWRGPCSASSLFQARTLVADLHLPSNKRKSPQCRLLGRGKSG
jgi:hypothetical protein